MLRLPGASVIDVVLGSEGIIVAVRLRRRRRVCSRCGQTGRHLTIHDRRVKRWRHLDLGANRCVIECELRRLAARTAACASKRCHGRGPARITRAILKTSWRGWRSRWPRPRSRGCCGSAGTPWDGLSSVSSPSSSTSRGWPAWSRSASTRSPIAAASATSPAWSTTRPVRSCGARPVATPRRCRRSSTSSDPSSASRSGRSRST